MSECIQIQILYKYGFEGKNISLRGNIMSDAQAFMMTKLYGLI